MVATLDELPNYLRERVLALGFRDPEAWVTKPLPALDGRSVVQVVSEVGGEDRIRRLLTEVENGFPTGA